MKRSAPLRLFCSSPSTRKMPAPQRGEVWLIDFGLAGKTRPALVVSGAFGDQDPPCSCRGPGVQQRRPGFFPRRFLPIGQNSVSPAPEKQALFKPVVSLRKVSPQFPSPQMGSRFVRCGETIEAPQYILPRRATVEPSDQLPSLTERSPQRLPPPDAVQCRTLILGPRFSLLELFFRSPHPVTDGNPRGHERHRGAQLEIVKPTWPG